MGKIRGFREAPVEAVAEFSRGMCLPTLFIYNGLWYAFTMSYTFVWACIAPATTACNEESAMGPFYRYSNAVIGVMECALALAMYSRRLPARWSEKALCTLHVVQAGFVLNAPSQYQFNVFVDVSMGYSWVALALMGVRRVPYVCCVVLEVMLVPCIAMWRDFSISLAPTSGFDLFYSLTLVIALQHHWAQLHDCQQALRSEQEASEVLFAMLGDAKFWVASDGNTILSQDSKLESILGMPMVGERLDKHMRVSEQQRWNNIIQQMVPDEAQNSAVLVTTTIEHRTGAPLDVDLFIVDRRDVFTRLCDGGLAKYGSGDAQGDRSGFLIGLRLVQQAPPPLPSPQEGSPVTGTPSTEFSWIIREQPSLARAGTSESIPSTMLSTQLPQPDISLCTRQELEEQVLSITWTHSSFTSAQAIATLLDAIQLVCDRAQGGALLCVAEKAAFDKVFRSTVEMRDQVKPCLRTSDAGYMTSRLKGIHISDDRFTSAFTEFTEHAESDRWPEDHPDLGARSQPKDGAFLVSTSGYCIKCAVKILGLPPPRSWRSVGTKHEAALACAWAVQGCCVFVRSDAGMVHVILREGYSLHVRQLDLGV